VRKGRPAAIAIAAGLVVIVGGIGALLLTRPSPPALRPVAAATQAAGGGAALPAPTGPLIGVKTSLITLGLASDGSMQVPSSTTVAGWYTGSPRPGGVGSAIIVGHVDSLTGPGVFYKLPRLHNGDIVYVKRADGTTAEFRVTSVQTYPKNQFPTQTVYSPTPDAELRLITCGGAFDPATHHYLSNIVVYASEVG
jgi:Sortase domain